MAAQQPHCAPQQWDEAEGDRLGFRSPTPIRPYPPVMMRRMGIPVSGCRVSGASPMDCRSSIRSGGTPGIKGMVSYT